LGRGGSDLTAVLLASELHADRCELIKDVPGYFSSDPRTHPEATPIAALTYDRALEMAAQGCDLVQVQAIVAARRTRTPLVIRGLDEKAPRTVVAADVVDHLLNPYKPTALVVG
jgi:aspartate kinase